MEHRGAGVVNFPYDGPTWLAMATGSTVMMLKPLVDP